MSAPSYVYFIRPIGMLGPVKIGFAEFPRRRLDGLAAWSPFPLEVIATVDGSFALEQAIHSEDVITNVSAHAIARDAKYPPRSAAPATAEASP